MEKRKVGKISNEEKKFISMNKSHMSDSEIAKDLNRSVDFVTKYRVSLASTISGEAPKATLVQDVRSDVRQKLKDSYAWQTLKQELSINELNHFVEIYVDVTVQFKGDLTSTEEIQIGQVAKFEVLMSRELIARKAMMDKIEQLEEELRQLPHRDERSDYERDRAKQIDELLMNYRSNSINSYKSFLEFETKKEALLKSLKLTRDQRISKIDKINISWPDVIRRLADEEGKDVIGLELTMSKKSYEKEFNRLSKPHTFTNGTVDLPLLSSETYAEETNGADTINEAPDKKD